MVVCVVAACEPSACSKIFFCQHLRRVCYHPVGRAVD